MAENGSSVPSVEVLAERIGNVSKKLDEQVALSKTSVDAALTAIAVAKGDQERTVTVAFAASALALSKTEQSQKESNGAISTLQNEVVRLAVLQAAASGSRGGAKEMYGYIFGVIMLLVAIASVVAMVVHR